MLVVSIITKSPSKLSLHCSDGRTPIEPKEHTVSSPHKNSAQTSLGPILLAHPMIGPDRHVRTVNFPTPAAVLKSNSLLPGKGRVSNARGNVGYYKLIGTIFCIATKLLICGCFLHKVRPVLVKQLLCHKTKEFRPK